MIAVPMHEAKTNLSQLVAAAEDGEEVIIMRDDVPVVRLVPVGQPKPTRKFGSLAGKVSVTAEFFERIPNAELSEWDG